MQLKADTKIESHLIDEKINWNWGGIHKMSYEIIYPEVSSVPALLSLTWYTNLG